MSLDELGVTAGTLSDFQIHAAAGCVLGRVAVSIRDEYRVLTETGEVQAEPCGALLYGASSRAELPATGDWVALRTASATDAVVVAVLPRTTNFSRRAAGTRTEEQVIAANVDAAFIVCGLDHDFNIRRIERYLTVVYESGARPVVVLTKSDLCGEVGARAASVVEVARGVPVAVVSSVTDGGLNAVEPYLEPRKTFVLVGSSGAGKSTLLNRLLQEDRQSTAPVRDSDSRGRHTTTRRELIVLPSGAILIDTPGMREVGLWAGEGSLARTFDEIAQLATGCRYRDCSHTGEPGCAVAGAVDPERLESFRKLQRELRHTAEATDKMAAIATKRKWRTIHKSLRAFNKMNG